MTKNIVSSYHHSFAGGSKNTSRLLHSLSLNGFDVDAFFFERPQYFCYTDSKVRIHLYGRDIATSEVINPEFLKGYYLANEILTNAHNAASLILFGANLFPYCDLLLDVKFQMRHQDRAKLVVHPVGSDIWQIGSKLKAKVKFILDNPLVDNIVTYSPVFVSEIKEQFGVEAEIKVLPPIIEIETFFPLSDSEISKRRDLLGFGDDVFVMHHHSSMRKVKCPEIVISIASRAAQLIDRKCILIMTGPLRREVICDLNLESVFRKDNEILKYSTELGNLVIYWTGVLSDVTYLMQISNVELNSSLHDSFNLALMEAMACGVPVVTSNVVGISEHVERSDGGYCFPTRRLDFDHLNNVLATDGFNRDIFDLDYAVNAIIALAENPVGTKLRGQRAAAYVLTEFRPENAVKRFCSYISK